jgi:hypothetical protein
MSHGGANHQIHGVDDQTVHLINDLVAPFKNCPSLNGKPKLFFVNTGRSSAVQIALVCELLDDMGRLRALDEADGPAFSRRVSSEGDILIHYATAENSLAYRNPDTGSYFISALCYVLDNHAMDENVDLVRLLRMANERVMIEKSMQIPEISNSLQKRFYFNLNKSKLSVSATEP